MALIDRIDKFRDLMFAYTCNQNAAGDACNAWRTDAQAAMNSYSGAKGVDKALTQRDWNNLINGTAGQYLLAGKNPEIFTVGKTTVAVAGGSAFLFMGAEAFLTSNIMAEIGAYGTLGAALGNPYALNAAGITAAELAAFIELGGGTLTPGMAATALVAARTANKADTVSNLVKEAQQLAKTGDSARAVTKIAEASQELQRASTAKGGTDGSPIVLDLFGGKTSQIPGAINIDIIAGLGIKASATKLPIQPGSVDRVISSNPYIPGGAGIMDWLPEAATSLKPGGQLIINSTARNIFGQLPNAQALETGPPHSECIFPDRIVT